MDNTALKPTNTERRGLALAALIMSLVALFCSLITGWRIFSLVVAAASMFVAFLVLLSVRQNGRSRRMSVIAMIVSVGAALLAWYYLANLAGPRQDVIPSELNDSAAVAPDEGTLEKLRMSMDSTQATSSVK